MFPTGRTEVEGPADRPERVNIGEEDIDSKLRTVISQLRPMKIAPREDVSDDEQDDSIPRPGSSYQFYRSESSLPETARVFYETAAKLSGLSLHSLIRAVFQTELKVQQWQENQRRAEYHGQHLDEDSPMTEDAMEGDDVSTDDMAVEQASDLE